MSDAIEAAAPAAAENAGAPLRINTLGLCDFRAFPNPVELDLHGKNLLVFGENGAGKSSVFHALRNFFALKPTPIASVKMRWSRKFGQLAKVGSTSLKDGLYDWEAEAVLG